MIRTAHPDFPTLSGSCNLEIFTTMPEPGDIPLAFHPSFNEIIDSFRTMIAALTWLRAAPEAAEKHFAPWHYVITFDCTVSTKSIKVDKSAFVAFQTDAQALGTPLFASTLTNLCRVVTISVKDIIAEHPDFVHVRNEELLQFLRHVRNAAPTRIASISVPAGNAIGR